MAEGKEAQLLRYPKMEESMPQYLDRNFKELEQQVNDLQARVAALEAKVP